MNKRQLEVLKTQSMNEKKIIRLLKRIYQQASRDCETKIRELAGRTDMENIQSIIYQKQYQEALKKQLDGILDALQNNEFENIAEYLTRCYEDGFIGTLYDLHGQGIPLIFPIDQSQVVKAVQTDSKISTNLYNRLGEDVTYLKKSIRTELSRGISNGSTWAEIATHIAYGMNSPFRKAMNNTMRIARTEGHRIQNQAQMDTLNKAKEKGADVVKQWDSTLDGRTRPTHQILDGQIREIEDYFEVNGHRAKYPGGFGIASEDIHCRCCMLQRARWALDQGELDTLKERAAFFGLDKTEDFTDFRNKYLQLPGNAGTMDLKDIQLGELESAYGKKHSAALRKQIESSPDEVKRVWNACVGDFHCLDPKYRGNKAYYSPGYDGVKLNISKAAKGSGYQTPYQVVFHEYGHHVDYILNRKYGTGDRMKSFSETYDGGILGKTLKKEAKGIVEDFARKQKLFKCDPLTVEDKVDRMIKRGLIDQTERDKYIEQYLKDAETIDWEKAEQEFCSHIRKELNLMQRSDISDMFEPIMSEKCAYPFGVGHGTNYWRIRDNGKEGFAEMYSAMVDNPESLEQIKRFFPESFKIFQKMLGVVK